MKALRLSKFAIHSIKNPLAITDENNRFVQCNSAYLDLIGRSSAEVIGRHFGDAVSVQFARLELDVERKLISSNLMEIEYQVEFIDLHPFKVRVVGHKSILLDHAGHFNGFVTIFQVEPFIFYDVISRQFEFTAQETHVSRFLIEGHSVKEVAKFLGVSNHTITGHMKEIYGKAKVNSRSELQYLALKAAISPLERWRQHAEIKLA